MDWLLPALTTVSDTLITDFDFAANHNRSYEYFMRDALLPLVAGAKPIDYTSGRFRHRVSWANPRFGRPTFTCNGRTTLLTPEEAVRRGLDYTAPLFVDVVYTKTPTGRPETLVVELGPIKEDDDGDTAMKATEEVEAPPLPEVETTTVHPGLQICSVPVMENGFNCNARLLAQRRGLPGGAVFISNGNRRVVPPLRTLMWNTIVAGKCLKPAKYSHQLEIRSFHHSSKYNSTATSLLYLTKPSKKFPGQGQHVCIKVPRVVGQFAIPVGVYFLALGWGLDDILPLVREAAEDDWFETVELRVKSIVVAARQALAGSGMLPTRENALRYVFNNQAKTDTAGKSLEDALKDTRALLDSQLLPQMNGEHYDVSPSSEDEEMRQNHDKGKLLAYAIFDLLSVASGHRPPDDRDNLRYICYDSCGTLLARLFRQILGNFTKDAFFLFKFAIENSLPIEWQKVYPAKNIDKIFHRCMNTGEWCAKRGANVAPRKDVSQLLVQQNVKSALSHLMKLSTTLTSKSGQSKARQVHETQKGRVCAVETPESGSCGLVGFAAFGSRLSLGSCPYQLMRLLRRLAQEFGVWSLQESPPSPSPSPAPAPRAKIFVNGIWFGWTLDPTGLVRRLRALRRAGSVHRDTSLSYDGRVFRVSTMSDRLIRPLLVLSEATLDRLREWHSSGALQLLSAVQLEQKGIVEFVDTPEELTGLIAFSLNDFLSRKAAPFTHLEINPGFMLGLGAFLIPLLDHNQSPRNTYFAAMGKHACAPNVDGSQHSKTQFELPDAEVPLVQTQLARLREPLLHADGENLRVAVVPYYGRNQEDAVLVNKGFIERMGLTALHSKLYREEQRKGAGNSRAAAANKTLFEKPDPETTLSLKLAESSHILPDGRPKVGTILYQDYMVYGKTVAAKPGRADAKRKGKGPSSRAAKRAKLCKRDDSKVQHSEEPAQVVVAERIQNGRDPAVMKVITQSYRIPDLGDKFTSRHGQKGTLGWIIPQEDMPFDELTGHPPDVIINPLGFPSRMTIAQALEMILGDVAVIKGQVQEYDGFRPLDMKEIADVLVSAGMRPDGERLMRNGITGKMMQQSVFMAPCFTLRLKQSPHDKIHARSFGPRMPLTRQPVPGRQKDGGHRLGEMEKDVLIAHGASAILQERLCQDSDPYEMGVCKRCRVRTTLNPQDQWAYCSVCESGKDVQVVDTSYSLDLISNELFEMSVQMMFETRTLDEDAAFS